MASSAIVKSEPRAAAATRHPQHEGRGSLKLVAPLYPSIGSLTSPDLPEEALKVVQYIPRHLWPMLNAPVHSDVFGSVLLPTAYSVDALGRSEWFMNSRARLLADPVASLGYRSVFSISGIRRPAELDHWTLNKKPVLTPFSRVGATASAPKRVIDTATVRLLFSRKAKRIRGVILPARNWEFIRGLEERCRLVECAVTDDIPLLVS